MAQPAEAPTFDDVITHIDGLDGNNSAAELGGIFRLEPDTVQALLAHDSSQRFANALGHAISRVPSPSQQANLGRGAVGLFTETMSYVEPGEVAAYSARGDIVARAIQDPAERASAYLNLAGYTAEYVEAAPIVEQTNYKHVLASHAFSHLGHAAKAIEALPEDDTASIESKSKLFSQAGLKAAEIVDELAPMVLTLPEEQVGDYVHVYRAIFGQPFQSFHRARELAGQIKDDHVRNYLLSSLAFDMLEANSTLNTLVSDRDSSHGNGGLFEQAMDVVGEVRNRSQDVGDLTLLASQVAETLGSYNSGKTILTPGQQRQRRRLASSVVALFGQANALPNHVEGASVKNAWPKAAAAARTLMLSPDFEVQQQGFSLIQTTMYLAIREAGESNDPAHVDVATDYFDHLATELKGANAGLSVYRLLDGILDHAELHARGIYASRRNVDNCLDYMQLHAGPGEILLDEVSSNLALSVVRRAVDITRAEKTAIEQLEYLRVFIRDDGLRNLIKNRSIKLRAELPPASRSLPRNVTVQLIEAVANQTPPTSA